MKWFWVLSTVILGALAGATLLYDPGYVLIRAGDLVFESSIAAGILTALILASVVSIFYAGIRRVLLSVGLITKWRADRQHSKASDSWHRGVLAFARGDWQGAAMALKGAPIPRERLLESLLLRAWHLVRAGDRSALQQLLESTSANHPEHSAALELGVARWQMQDGVFEDAKKRVAELPGSTEQAGLLLWSHIQNADWSAVSAQWPMAEKQGVLKAESFRGQMALLRAGKAMADSIDAAQQDEPAWRIGLKGLPKQWQSDATTIQFFADMLLNGGHPKAARELLQQVLSKQWQPALVRAYGEISADAHLETAIEQLRGWLKKKPQDPELLLALGRLLRVNGQHTQSHKCLVTAAKTIPSGDEATAESAEAVELGGLVTLELGRLNLATAL
ncbi:MAG: hypothetical protein ISP99_01835 [Pseudomonadales bacterium]|nr:hypothetical protein [Pseudomonadales bacterium]